MSAENKAVVRRVFESFNRGELDEAARNIGSDYVYHGPAAELRGPEGWKQVAGMYRSAFPDVICTIDEQIAEGDVVVTRFTARGTHRGELAGVAGSGRTVTVPVVSITRVIGGKLVDEFEVFDQLAMFQAIGTLPALHAAV